MKHNIINTCMLFTAFFFTGSLYADQKLSPLEKKLNLITITVNKLCKAPSKEKSSYYKISANGKVGLNIKFTDLKTKVFFTKKEWKGFQRVLRKDQASDNRNYRTLNEIGEVLTDKSDTK